MMTLHSYLLFVNLGGYVHLTAAVLGLSAILATSAQ